MVFFTCGECNATLKKNKVDLHFVGRCRNAAFVSCVDCSKDFYGNDYATHTSCISEAEKYGGKDYKAAANVNKGQKKQELWVDKVQKVLDGTNTDNPKLRDILESLLSYPNIPRKKPKFINFLKNTFARYRREDKLFEEVWKMLEESKVEEIVNQEIAEIEKTEPFKPPKTKKRKKDETNGDNAENEPSEPVVPKKRKKVKFGEDGEEEEITESEIEALREKKRLKREQKENGIATNGQEIAEGRLNETLETEEKSSKDFNWETFINDILAKKGEISLKKLRKLSIAEFKACNRQIRTEERIWRKLDKKLHSMNNVQVVKEKVSFKQT